MSRAEVGEPLVSVGVPVYNGERLLGQALESLRAQGHRNIEIIVSDNASQDGTEAVARAHAQADPRVRYHRQKENIGVLANFDFVASQASGRYFFWAAHDDIREPNFVEELVGALERHGVSMAYCNYDWIDEDGRPVGMGKTQYFVSRESRLRDAFSFSPENGRVHNASLHYLWRNSFLTYGLFRTDIVKAALPFECLFSHVVHADTVFLMKVFAQHRAVAVDKVLFHYRAKSRTLQERYTVPGQNAIEHLSERDIDRTLRRRSLEILRDSGFSRRELAMMRLVLPSLDIARHLRERLRAVGR